MAGEIQLGDSLEYGNAQNERQQDAEEKYPEKDFGDYGEAGGNPGETEDPEDHSEQCANQCPFNHVQVDVSLRRKVVPWARMTAISSREKSAVPTGLKFVFYVYPALKGGAIIFRPAPRDSDQVLRLPRTPLSLRPGLS